MSLSKWCMNMNIGVGPVSSLNPLHSPNPSFAEVGGNNLKESNNYLPPIPTQSSSTQSQSHRIISPNQVRSRSKSIKSSAPLSIQVPTPEKNLQSSIHLFSSQAATFSPSSRKIPSVEITSGSNTVPNSSRRLPETARDVLRAEKSNRGLIGKVPLEKNNGLEGLNSALEGRNINSNEISSSLKIESRGRRIEEAASRSSSLPIQNIVGFGERLDRRVSSKDRSNNIGQASQEGSSYDKNSSFPPLPVKRSRPPPITIPPPKLSKKLPTIVNTKSRTEIPSLPSETLHQSVPQASTSKSILPSTSASTSTLPVNVVPSTFQPKSLQLLKPKPTLQHLRSSEIIPSISRRPQSLEVPSSAISSLSEKLFAVGSKLETTAEAPHFSMMSFPRDVTDNSSIDSGRSMTFGKTVTHFQPQDQAHHQSKQPLDVPFFLPPTSITSSSDQLGALPTISIPTLSRPTSLLLPSLPILPTRSTSSSPIEAISQSMQRSNSNRTLPPAYSSRNGNGVPLKEEMELALRELERLKVNNRVEELRAKYQLELNYRSQLLTRHVACLKGFNGVEGARFAATLVHAIARVDRVVEELQIALETTVTSQTQELKFKSHTSELDKVRSERDEALRRLELLEGKFSRMEQEKKKAGVARGAKEKKPLTPESDYDESTDVTRISHSNHRPRIELKSRPSQSSLSPTIARAGTMLSNQSYSNIQSSKPIPSLVRHETTSSRKLNLPLSSKPSLSNLNLSYSSRTLPPPPPLPVASPTKFHFSRTTPATPKITHHSSVSRSQSKSSSDTKKEELRNIFHSNSVTLKSPQPRLLRSASDPLFIPLPLVPKTSAGNHHQYSSSAGNLLVEGSGDELSDGWGLSGRRRGMTSIKFNELHSRELVEMLERMEK